MTLTLSEIAIRLGIAIVVGGLIGYEREIRNKPAGFLTFTLVCFGSALIAILQIRLLNTMIDLQAANPNLENVLTMDLGRVVAQVVSGIGFLGAGAIIHRSGFVQGVTTAALLWVSAGMGLVIGMGYYEIVAISVLMILPIIFFTRGFQVKLGRNRQIKKIRIVYLEAAESYFLDILKENGVKVRRNFLHNTYMKNEETTKESYLYFVVPKGLELVDIINLIHDVNGVIEIETI